MIRVHAVASDSTAIEALLHEDGKLKKLPGYVGMLVLPEPEVSAFRIAVSLTAADRREAELRATAAVECALESIAAHFGQPGAQEQSQLLINLDDTADPVDRNSWGKPCWHCGRQPGLAWDADDAYACCPDCRAD